MYQKLTLKIPHLIGAIGCFIEAAVVVISLAMSQSYTADFDSFKIISVLEIAANSLIIYCFFAMFGCVRDSVIKMGALIAALGVCWQIFLGDVLMSLFGVALPSILLIIGSLAVLAGEIMICIRYITFFGKDVIIVVFCVFVFFGLLFSLIFTWGSIITNGAFGGILIYFYVHNVTY